MLYLSASLRVICEAQSHCVPGQACTVCTKLRTSYCVDDTNYLSGIRAVHTMTIVNILSERLIYQSNSTREHTKRGYMHSEALEQLLVELLTIYRIKLVSRFV